MFYRNMQAIAGFCWVLCRSVNFFALLLLVNIFCDPEIRQTTESKGKPISSTRVFNLGCHVKAASPRNSDPD